MSAIPEVLSRLARDPGVEARTRDTVASILAEVRAGGPEGGLERALAIGARLDGVTLDAASARVPPSAMRAAADTLAHTSSELVSALGQMIEHVRTFALAQRAALSDVRVPLPGGGEVGERWLPLRRVGVYV
ncbi:MAG: histidinol dehydrogenase, partial [Myxococcales bacterium]|nr:histidinol dehydrogenase [Myxococcales bacterium]